MTKKTVAAQQAELGLVSSPAKAAPVECLGMTFESDDARRAHFLRLLAEKLQDPEFRKTPGFPQGSDEDILRLSDPPYYTACPNPFLADYVAAYGKPFNPAQKYQQEPFASDVSEGKNHPVYRAHSYHTKVPHRAIRRYIDHYTSPGDLILDVFCGTGMTGVAAQEPNDIREEAAATARRAILVDLSPAATEIAASYNLAFSTKDFRAKARKILAQVKAELGHLYDTPAPNGPGNGTIDYVIWSDHFTCPEGSGSLSERACG